MPNTRPPDESETKEREDTMDRFDRQVILSSEIVKEPNTTVGIIYKDNK